MNRPNAEVAIIGGGVIGLAIARELLLREPARRVVVFDKEATSTAHASGRNSGVLHAGFYYAPDSLKARLTRDGNTRLKAFCRSAGVPVRECGKVVVTRGEQEIPALEQLHERGLANGVTLTLIDEKRLAEIEPLARTQGLALWSPTTAAADPVSVVSALAADVHRMGGHLRYGHEVLAAEPGRVLTARSSGGDRSHRLLEIWRVGHIVNCAGVFADRVADWFGLCPDYRVVPFKGNYRYGNWAPGRLRRHVYPVPDPRNPFLGVHTTVTAAGRVKIGPTAIPVLGREAYRGFDTSGPAEAGEVLASLRAFLGSDEHDAAGLVRTEVPKVSTEVLAREAAELVPDIRAADFTEKGRPGIRAQLMNRETGALEMDFVVRGDRDSTHVLNAVSPAWTTSLAFAEHVVAGADALA